MDNSRALRGQVDHSDLIRHTVGVIVNRPRRMSSPTLQGVLITPTKAARALLRVQILSLILSPRFSIFVRKTSAQSVGDCEMGWVSMSSCKRQRWKPVSLIDKPKLGEKKYVGREEGRHALLYIRDHVRPATACSPVRAMHPREQSMRVGHGEHRFEGGRRLNPGSLVDPIVQGTLDRARHRLLRRLWTYDIHYLLK